MLKKGNENSESNTCAVSREWTSTRQVFTEEDRGRNFYSESLCAAFRDATEPTVLHPSEVGSDQSPPAVTVGRFSAQRNRSAMSRTSPREASERPFA